VRTKGQSWIKEGRIGNLIHVKADFGYPLPYRLEGREYDNRSSLSKTMSPRSRKSLYLPAMVAVRYNLLMLAFL
jgi:hypothetical protein